MARYVDINKARIYVSDFVCEQLKKIPTADVVEIEILRDWLWDIALNNVGCDFDGNFSIVCQEIISRLDGLRKFAQERK